MQENRVAKCNACNVSHVISTFLIERISLCLLERLIIVFSLLSNRDTRNMHMGYYPSSHECVFDDSIIILSGAI